MPQASGKDGGIGAALRSARKRRGLTQGEAAELLGTHTTQIARYEQGKREAPLSFLRRAEQVYEARIVDAPSGVARETVPRARETPSHLYNSQPLARSDLLDALLALERMCLSMAELARRIRRTEEE